MMKQIINLIFSALILLSCNNDVKLNINPDEQRTPDYNLLIEKGSYFAYPNTTDSTRFTHFEGIGVIYLRPFENVNPLDVVTLSFTTSNKSSAFVIAGDTLFSGDKKQINYSAFQKYLLNFRYITQNSGNHNITIGTSIKNVTKNASCEFITIY